MNSELIYAWKNAWSIESREGTGDLEVIAQMKSPGVENRVYIIFRDTTGRYWYKTVFQGEEGLLSEEEHIFGRKNVSRRRNMSHASRKP